MEITFLTSYFANDDDDWRAKVIERSHGDLDIMISIFFTRVKRTTHDVFVLECRWGLNYRAIPRVVLPKWARCSW